MYVKQDKSEQVNRRTLLEARYILETNKTMRQAAKDFGVSRSTINMDMIHRLKKISHDLYKEVKEVLDQNKAKGYILGGTHSKRSRREVSK